MLVRVYYPTIVSPCFDGIDMATEQELIAAGRSIEDVREAIGATSLAYLSLEGLQAATRRPEGTFCRACLTKRYPTRTGGSAVLGKHRFELASA